MGVFNQNDDAKETLETSEAIETSDTLESQETLEETSNPLETHDTEESIPLPIYSKKNKKNIVAIIIASIVILGAITGFIFKDNIANQVMLFVKTPAEYYQYVEGKNISSGIDTITDYHSTIVDAMEKSFESGNGVNITSNLTISPTLTGLLGIGDIGSIKWSSDIMTKGFNQQIASEILYNDQSLIHLNGISDNDSQTIYMQIPELSSAYLLIKLSELMYGSNTYDSELYQSTYNDVMKAQQMFYDGTISPDTINDILDTYSKVVINSLKTVEENGATKLTISDKSAAYTSLTVSITSTDIYNIAYNILNTAKSDTKLQDLAVKLGVTANDYTSGIENALLDLEEEKDSIAENSEALYMTVYVDGQGNIVGRKFATQDNDEVLGYHSIKKGSNKDFTFYYKEGNETILDVTGNATLKHSKLSGEVNIQIADEMSPFSAKVTYKDMEYAKDSGLNGNFVLTSDSLNGASLEFNLSGDAKAKQLILKFLYGNIEGVTFSMDAKEVPYEDITALSDSDVVYNMSEDGSIEEYLATIDFESFYKHIQDVIGIDLSYLLNYMY